MYEDQTQSSKVVKHVIIILFPDKQLSYVSHNP